MAPNSDSLLTQLQGFIDQIPFARELGISVREARRGGVSLAVRPQEKLFNHFGTYQAGVLFTLAEVTGGALYGTFLDLSQNLVLTKQGEIEFQKTTAGELLSEAALEENEIERILSELRSQRKLDLPQPIFLNTREGQRVATARFSYYLRLGIPRSLTPPLKEGPS